MEGELAWAHAVMNGWEVAHTPAHTVPLPRSLMLLFVVHLVVLKMPILGVALYLQHCQGLRPSEVLGISISDIRLPGDDVGAPDVATIALGLRTGTKAKRAQFTIVKDKRAIALLRWAIQRSTGEKLFPVSYGTYRSALKKHCLHLNLDLKITPHSPRAGFATQAIADGIPFLTVMELGRWLSESSLRCYVDIVTAASISVSLRSKGLLRAMAFADQDLLTFFPGASVQCNADSRHHQGGGWPFLPSVEPCRRSDSSGLSRGEESQASLRHPTAARTVRFESDPSGGAIGRRLGSKGGGRSGKSHGKSRC